MATKRKIWTGCINLDRAIKAIWDYDWYETLTEAQKKYVDSLKSELVNLGKFHASKQKTP